MKVTLDLARLLREGKITREEFDRLASYAAHDTGSLAVNILIGFGVIAVAGGALALVPTPLTAILLGGIVMAVGLGILVTGGQRWVLLANICILAGALMLGGGIVIFFKGSVAAMLAVAAIFAVAGVFAGSGLLIVAAVLALSSCIGVRTGYFHATYLLGVQEPGTTVILFSLLALLTYLASKRLPDPFDRLSIVAARASLFLVNFGFWIGSLWGDRMVWLRRLADPAVEDYTSAIVIGRDVFSIAWALGILAVGAWAMHANKRWVLNLVAVFGAIHFYTQWFERLGATPASVLLGGLLILAFAFGLWQFNRRRIDAVQPAGGV
jgi:hypothetical protein